MMAANLLVAAAYVVVASLGFRMATDASFPKFMRWTAFALGALCFARAVGLVVIAAWAA